MNAKLLKIENGEAHIKFFISGKKMQEALDEVYLQNKDTYQVENVNSSVITRELIEKKYGENVYLQAALDLIVPNFYNEAINKFNVQAIAAPDIEVGDVIKNKRVEVNVKVPILPEFSLDNLQNMEVFVAKPTEVTEKAINKYLEDLRQEHKIVIDKNDAVIAIGDTVTISYQYSIKETDLEEKQEHFKIIIGDQLFPDEVEDKLVGHKKGDLVKAEVRLPKNHVNSQLVGKKAVFKIKIIKVENIKIRDLDDQFAKDIAGLDSLATLRLDCANKLQQVAVRRDETGRKQAVVNALLKRCTFDLSDAVIVPMAQTLLEQFKNRLVSEGGNIDLYLQIRNINMDKLKLEIWDVATNITKSQYIIDKLLQETTYSVTDEELNQCVERFAINNGMEVSTAKDNLGPLLEKMCFEIKAGKAIQAVLDKAIITVA